MKKLCLSIIWRTTCIVALTANISPAVAEETHIVAYTETPLTNNDRDHWSFKPVAAVNVPEDAFPEWRRSSIDNFIGHTLAQKNLTPQPAAHRYALLRRLKFDLLGLPPTPDEIAAFVESDHDDEAFEKLVDSFLQQPAYGERWAQHWLDLARFAETDGFEHDRIRPDAWKYRDWVITALNADLPYDDFLRLQIAGDEIQSDDESATVATMFCLSGPDMPDINLAEERRHTVLNELTSTVGEVVLGLQIGCAQCHDHKYDPVSQADFYRMRAIFEPAIQLHRNKSLGVLAEQQPFEAKSHLMLRGDFRSPGPIVQPATLRVISRGDAALAGIPVAKSSGRRTALANWLVAPTNPLTARVIVNRIWQLHFGRGLVNTPSDFGVLGAEPTHPELLDWLAGGFIENGWSIKKLHRLILTSAAWQQRTMLPPSSTDGEAAAWKKSMQQDRDTQWLSRYPRRRLEGEVIRDTMLAAGGILNRKTAGPGIRPPLPEELLATLLHKQWEVTGDKSEHYRRSIYVFARRNLRYPIFEVFDRPSGNASCSQRGNSTTAPQSLHLLNSRFSLEMAERLAEFVTAESATLDSQIRLAFLRTLCRPASELEVRESLEFLWDGANQPNHSVTPLTHLCLSLMNCNEFVFVD